MINWSNANVLVTGGHGFLGSHLLEALRKKGCTRLYAPARAECDLRDAAAVDALIKRGPFDRVFHLAASVGGIGANRETPADFFYDNMAMGIHVIDRCARAKVGRLVLLGTICAYPKFAPVPFREESLWDGYPEETNAPYGVAKRALLVAAEAYRTQYGLDYAAVFPTNLYGPRDDFDLERSHVIPAMIRKFEEARRANRKKVDLWGTGSPSRDFLYVTDAVEGILCCSEGDRALGGVFNLGSGREVTIRELSSMIAKAVGFQGEIQWDPARPDGQPRRCVSGERVEKVLGFKPQVSLEEGIAKTVAWYREHSQR